MEDDCSEPTTNTPTKKMDFFPDIMRHKVSLWKQFTLPPLTKIQVTVVTKIFGLIHTEHKYFLWTGRHVCPASRIHEVMANKSF